MDFIHKKFITYSDINRSEYRNIYQIYNHNISYYIIIYHNIDIKQGSNWGGGDLGLVHGSIFQTWKWVTYRNSLKWRFYAILGYFGEKFSCGASNTTHHQELNSYARYSLTSCTRCAFTHSNPTITKIHTDDNKNIFAEKFLFAGPMWDIRHLSTQDSTLWRHFKAKNSNITLAGV